MRRRDLIAIFAACTPSIGAPRKVPLPLRSRVEAYRGSGVFREVTVNEEIDPAASAIILCDMWNSHWCKGAVDRVNQMVGRFNPFLKSARSAGMLIVHAPSDTMEFYKDAPQRQKALSTPKVATPQPLALSDPALPVDSSDGGCDTPDKFYKAWSRQHRAITIEPQDIITDKGDEVYTQLKLRNIQHLFVAGVHTNMCILNRTFAIKQMTKWGVRCILVRDLTDAMYDPQDAPRVSHDQGTQLRDRAHREVLVSERAERATRGGLGKVVEASGPVCSPCVVALQSNQATNGQSRRN